jgi:hypothetical protein
MNKRTIFSRLLIITLMVTIVSVSGFAQDIYREALKENLLINNNFDQLKDVFININESLFEKNDNVELLTDRYIQEALVEHFVDVVEPIMKERNVTEADLRAVNAMLSTPEGQTFLSHDEEWNAKFKNALHELMPSFEEDSVAENVGEITVNPGIDAAYAAKFNNMMEACGIKQKMLSFMDGLFPSYSFEGYDELGKSNEIREMINNIKKWVDDNLATVALNNAYGILTPDDLDFGVKLYTNESHRKITDLSDMNFHGLMGKTADIMIKYIEWMESQGAQVTEKAKGLKKLMNMYKNWPDEEPKISEGPIIRD